MNSFNQESYAKPTCAEPDRILCPMIACIRGCEYDKDYRHTRNNDESSCTETDERREYRNI